MDDLTKLYRCPESPYENNRPRPSTEIETESPVLKLPSTPANTLSVPSSEISFCPSCQSMLIEPITLPCGHSFCKSCLQLNINCRCICCNRCYVLQELKQNVVMTKVLEKWWPNSVAAGLLLREAFLSFKKGKYHCTMKKLKKSYNLEKSTVGLAEAANIDVQDLECSLCMRLFWQPVTTPCGHVFCRVCLQRCLDHQPFCPLCKASLKEYLAERHYATTEFIEKAMQYFFPEEFIKRKETYEEEIDSITKVGADPDQSIPLFVCTTAFPTISCPLHIFEPRYRLMIRLCIESGSRQFGMCASQCDAAQGIAEYGTMLIIRDVEYFPDGRSIVDACGGDRFKVLSRGMKDGYHIAKVEFLKDVPVKDKDLPRLKIVHDHVYSIAEIWLNNLPLETHQRILQHFGYRPPEESNYASNPNGPAWLWWLAAVLPIQEDVKISFLGIVSLYKRLKSIENILIALKTSEPI